MENNDNKQNLKEKWGNFINVLFDPWVLILLFATLAFIYYFAQTEDKKLQNIVSLIISLISGLLGGIIANRWAQMTELKVLVARGKSAIRSLKLILLNISTIEKRTQEYIDCVDKENIEHKLIKSNFKEVIEKCRILEEEVVSSIENWTDIIPDIENAKTQIGIISEKNIKLTELESDILILVEQINKEKEKGKQINELEAKLKEREEQLNRTKAELQTAENKLDNTVLSGLTEKPNKFMLRASPQKIFLKNFPSNITIHNSKFGTCKVCGETKLLLNEVCDECSKKSTTE